MRRVLALGGAVLCLLAGCGTPPGGGGPVPPLPPTIAVFAASGGPFTDPALVPLVWNVSDPNGDDLTCRLDRDGDLAWDETIPHCQTPGGRTLTPPVGSYLAILEVTDGTHAPVTSTTTFDVVAGPTETYDITLRPYEPLAPEHQAAFDAAVTKWESVLSRGVSELPLSVPAGDCLDGAPAFDETVDDLVIEVAIRPIDGPGSILGQAGPCYVSTDDWLSRFGVMEFDSADVASMIANGTFSSVIVHEMGHVLGIGTLWNYQRSLLQGAGSANPLFVGPRASAAWSELGGGGGVPVENSGGSGTRDSHWRESVFADELMTGYIAAGTNPLSLISIGSLGDMGYHVDPAAADAYAVPGLPDAPTAASRAPLGTMLRPPVRPAS